VCAQLGELSGSVPEPKDSQNTLEKSHKNLTISMSAQFLTVTSLCQRKLSYMIVKGGMEQIRQPVVFVGENNVESAVLKQHFRVGCIQVKLLEEYEKDITILHAPELENITARFLKKQSISKLKVKMKEHRLTDTVTTKKKLNSYNLRKLTP